MPHNWNTFIYNNDIYIIKIIKLPLSYTINISNIVNIWSEELSNEDIVQKCKNFNPLITTDNETYIKVITSLTENELNENNIILKKTNNDIQLEYKTSISDVCFKFIFNLKLENNLSLCKELTVPAIQTIQYLEKRQKELCELLKRKDDEIQQHIFENGNIKRESVITEKFDQELFNQSLSKRLYCNVFTKSDDFNKVLISKYGCAEPELLTVKKEEKLIKKKKQSIAKQILKSKRPKIEHFKVEN